MARRKRTWAVLAGLALTLALALPARAEAAGAGLVPAPGPWLEAARERLAGFSREVPMRWLPVTNRGAGDSADIGGHIDPNGVQAPAPGEHSEIGGMIDPDGSSEIGGMIDPNG